MASFAKQQNLTYKIYGYFVAFHLFVPLGRKGSRIHAHVRSGSVPIMRLYGVTAEGHSVIAHVHGYEPYFYVQVLRAKLEFLLASPWHPWRFPRVIPDCQICWQAPAGMVPSQCQIFAEAMNKRMAERYPLCPTTLPPHSLGQFLQQQV